MSRPLAAATDVTLFGSRVAWLEGDGTSLAEDDAILATQSIKTLGLLLCQPKREYIDEQNERESEQSSFSAPPVSYRPS